MNNIPFDTLKDLILRYIADENLSMHDLERINILAYRGTGTMNDPSVGIVQNLFSVLTEKILLPDYIDEDDTETLYYELSEIVERTKSRALRTFGSNPHNNFFSVHLPNVDTIRAEFENFGQMEARYIDLGGVFDAIKIANHPRMGMRIHIPVRIMSGHVLPSGNAKKSSDPVMPQKELKYVVKSVMQHFRANYKENEYYQMTVGKTHFQVSINPEGPLRDQNVFEKQEILSMVLVDTAEGINDSMSD